MEKSKKEEIVCKLLSDDECVRSIVSASDSEEVKQIFRGKGLDLTDEQVEDIKNAISNELIKLSNMSDEEVEKIVGGADSNLRRVGYAAKEGIGHGTALGMWIGAGVGAAAGVVDASMMAYRGRIHSTWDFIKLATVTAIKSSLLGGAVGGGLGIASGPACEIGEPGGRALEDKKEIGVNTTTT